MKIILLGASGQVGSIVFDGLSKSHQVIGTSRRANGKHVRFNPFTDDWSLLGRADAVINCIGQIEPTQSTSFYDIHVELIKHIIRNREKIGHPRIVQVSALGAAPHHKVEFLRTKGLGDELLLQNGNTVVLRPSIICTHRTMIVRKMLLLSRIAKYFAGVAIVPQGFLKTRIQPVMPKDLIDAMEVVLSPVDHRIVNVVGPEAISFNDILTCLFYAKHQKLRIVQVPRVFVDAVVRTIIVHAFPQVLNAQQYELLFEDNIADPEPLQQLLRRSLAPASGFFKDEFSDTTE